MRPRLLDLPHGHRTLVDDADVPFIQKLGALYLGTNGYVYYSQWRDGRSTPGLLHRALLREPVGLHVDHINGDKLDNRRENLRAVSPSVNQANRKRLNRNNRSGIRGVALTSASSINPWRAQITVNGRNIHLGLYPTAEAALAVRQEAELRYFGERCP